MLRFPTQNISELMSVCRLVLQGEESSVDTYSLRHSRDILITYRIVLLVSYVLGMLYAAASTYTVAYIYSNEDVESDDESMTKKVFKLLPHALFRIFVTQLWAFLVVFPPMIACSFLSLLIIVLVFSAGFIGAKVFFYAVNAVVIIVGFGFSFSFSIVFVLVVYIAVLEPEKYGRAALKQTTKYVKGRAGIIFGGLVLNSLSGLAYAPLQPVIGKAGVPVWVKILVAILVSVLSSVITAYIGLVAVVTYFVCKSSFEADLPEFQRGSNISSVENPYEPIEHGRIYL
jgi:hypothetical protein